MSERLTAGQKDARIRKRLPDDLPKSVRYIKNGTGGQWWPAAKRDHQLHAGWSNISPALLTKPDFPAIRAAIESFQALRDLLDHPSQHVWITFEDGYMWWCTVRDGAHPNKAGESSTQGNFWLNCESPWPNESLLDRLLTTTDLPGDVTRVQGFKATVCKPSGSAQILRIIRGEQDPDALVAAQARDAYERALKIMVQKLSWKDFELLISLILDRTGWVRISRVGGPTEGIDLDVRNWSIDERAFVQVKSVADQAMLDEYVEKFRKRIHYDRMIFAVHSPRGTITPPSKDRRVQVWEGDRLAQLVMRLGLGAWVEQKLA